MLREGYAFCWLITMAVRQAWFNRRHNAEVDSLLMQCGRSDLPGHEGSPAGRPTGAGSNHGANRPEVVNVPAARGTGRDRLRAGSG
jgi:hypothetical protein